MSKAIFFTLSVLVLLLSGINCAAGKKVGSSGGKNVDSGVGSPPCTVGLILNPGDECSGSGYKIRNNGGDFPLVTGSYRNSCSAISIARGNTYNLNGYKYISPGSWTCRDLILTGKDDKAWIIANLPMSTSSSSTP